MSDEAHVYKPTLKLNLDEQLSRKAAVLSVRHKGNMKDKKIRLTATVKCAG